MNKNNPPELFEPSLNNVSFGELVSISGYTGYFYENSGEIAVEFQWVINIGLVNQTHSGQADLFFATLCASNQKLLQKLDHLGAYISFEVEDCCSKISLYCLEENFSAGLEAFSKLLGECSLDENVFKMKKSQLVANWTVGSAKPIWWANKLLMQSSWGPQPYIGFVKSVEDIQSLQFSDIVHFKTVTYLGSKASFFICSKCMPASFQTSFKTLTQLFENHPFTFNCNFSPKIIDNPLYHNLEKAEQNSLRALTHIDSNSLDVMPVLSVFNASFGGYFGSRLMKVIREEKGYTYGIQSYLSVKANHKISLEITSALKSDASSEVECLITDIFAELVSQFDYIDEFTKARRYLLGNTLRQLDGQFNRMSVHVKFFMNNRKPQEKLDSFAIQKSLNYEQFTAFVQQLLAKNRFNLCVAGRI